MKKTMIALVMLAVAGALFAQVTVSGSAQTDAGIYNAPTEGGANWYWDFLKNGRTYIQADAKAEKVSAWMRLRGDGVFMGNVTADLDLLKLSIGFNRLPVAFWSSYELYSDEHLGIGASATKRATYIQAKIGDFFIGLADSALSWENPSYDKDDDTKGPKEWSFSFLNDNPFTKAFSPIFYLGYDYKAKDSNDKETFSFGASFVGVYLSEDFVGNDVFSLMGNLHGKLLLLDPCTLGLNVSFYNAPSYGPFTLTKNITKNGKDAMVLEALLDVGVGIKDVCNLGFAAGLVMNLAEKDKGGGGLGVKLGLSAIFDLGGTGFKLVPGVAYSIYNDKAGDKDLVDAGVSFKYTF